MRSSGSSAAKGPDRTISCAWRGAGGCSIGPASAGYYVEPKRLARLGYLHARREPGKTRERTVCTLTEKGLDALRAYADTPVRFTPLKSDPLLRLLICDLFGEPVTRSSVVALREDIADLMGRLDDVEETARALEHRSKYLLLVIDFLRRYLELHPDLVDQVEREFSASPRPGDTSDLART
jgi:DNA-binding PadR family transcriptional regulator